ncbi:hypothetical protein [Geobacter sp. DSM 9736]|uniref:hypothetical protein n=1 Tax=Geobacter sp. DSM 9736 TaxID=1277350 RepID=UPI000B5039D8|nr:hypothetical protein [Geobacter sp. DSM 9736]SNB46633.1 hypothetical protein SAMN06269301_2101 [Geobacter sp. DSM 9736]
MIKRVLVTAAALSALVMASQAMAAPKLVVKDNLTPANDVFVVEDTGDFQVPGSFKFNNTSNFLGIGIDTPTAAFHVNYKTASAPFLLERELDNSGAVSLTADNYAAANGGSLVGSGMLFRFSKGTKSSPSNVANGDRLGFLTFGGMAGGAMRHTAAINALVDAGTISSTSLPTYIEFATTANGSVSRLERLRIAGDGRIRLSNQPAAPANNAACTTGDMILDAPNGFLYLCTGTNSWKRTSFAAY